MNLKSRDNVVLIMGNNSYVGREYASQLIKKNINFEIVIVGKRQTNIIDKRRTKGYWKPTPQNFIKNKRITYFFSNLREKKFLQLLKIKKYKLGIQGGGLGLISKKIIRCFKLGILNLHPGKLPNYRGSSAPELQIISGKKIYASYHLINEKIDSGKLILSTKLDLDYSSYEKMRAQIYPSMTKKLPYIIRKILRNDFNHRNLVKFEKKYLPNKYIGENFINDLKDNWNKYI